MPKTHLIDPRFSGFASRAICGKRCISRNAQTAHALLLTKDATEVDCSACKNKLPAVATKEG